MDLARACEVCERTGLRVVFGHDADAQRLARRARLLAQPELEPGARRCCRRRPRGAGGGSPAKMAAPGRTTTLSTCPARSVTVASWFVSALRAAGAAPGAPGAEAPAGAAPGSKTVRTSMTPRAIVDELGCVPHAAARRRELLRLCDWARAGARQRRRVEVCPPPCVAAQNAVCALTELRPVPLLAHHVGILWHL